MKNMILFLVALLASACAYGAPAGTTDDAPEADPPAWYVIKVFTTPSDAPCYEVGPAAYLGRRDLPPGVEDEVRVRRPAWGDPEPGGTNVRAWPGEQIELWADATKLPVNLDVYMIALEAPCQ